MAQLNFRTKTEGGGSFKIPPEATYDFEIADVIGLESEEGNPRLYLQLKIAEGAQEGEELRDYHTLSEERGWALRNILENTDTPFELSDESDGSGDFTFDTDDMLGRYFRADLTHYTNKKTKKTYANLNNVQVSPLQEAASGKAPVTNETAPTGGRSGRPRA